MPSRSLRFAASRQMASRTIRNVTTSRGLPDLRVEIEASLSKAPFWFDCHQMAWECRQCLNAALAMREVEVQFAQLIERLPVLIELRFRDGAPFADPAIRDATREVSR